MKQNINRCTQKKKLIANVTWHCSDEAGWTFVETLIVIVIILILMSSVGISAVKRIDKAKTATAKTQISDITSALYSYYIDCAMFPTEYQGLIALFEKPYLEPVPTEWDGPYLQKKVTCDPWGTPFIYEIPGPDGLDFAVTSLAADKQKGGEGKNGDIASWE